MSRIWDIISQHDLTTDGKLHTEGAATVANVVTRGGVDALLYTDPQERRAARAAAVHELAGPQLFAVPELIDSGPHWWLVHRPSGTRVSDIGGWTGYQAATHAASLGKALRKLHEVPVEPFCGDVLDPDEADSDGRWLTFNGYAANQLDWFSENVRHRELDLAQSEQVVRVIGDLRHELAAFHPRNPSTLCHGSLAPHHVWVDGVEVSGITGFQFAAQLPREADIAYLLWIGGITDELLITRFYDGYGAARTMDVQRRERFYRRLVALQALFDAKGEVDATTEQLLALTSPR